MDGRATPTGVAGGPLSLGVGTGSDARGGVSATSSERATDGPGLGGVAGGASDAPEFGASGRGAGSESTSGSRERRTRGRGS